MSARVVCYASYATFGNFALPVSRYFMPLRFSSNFNMVGINGPHLKTGDAQPPLQKGLLRLYNMRFCPYAQRAVLVLDAKNVPYDTVNANLTTKPEWLFQKSDGAKVPAIEFEDGTVLSESLIISDYLDEAYPDPPLYPKDPRAKALDRLLIEKFGGATRAFYKILVSEGGVTPENFEELVSILSIYENELAKRGTKFLGGSSPGMLDLMIWPWVERAPLLALKGGTAFSLPQGRLPLLMAWKDAMVANPQVRLSALPASVHKQFTENRKNGVYDFEHDSHL